MYIVHGIQFIQFREPPLYYNQKAYIVHILHMAILHCTAVIITVLCYKQIPKFKLAF